MFINVQVHHASLPQWQSADQVYRPELSVFPRNHDHQAIEHLDLVTTWKGLSVAQAKELCSWQEGFRRSISEFIEVALLERFDRAGMDLSKLETDDAETVEAFEQVHMLVNSMGRTSLRCKVRKLIENMVYYHEVDGFEVESSWLTSEGAIPGILSFIQTLHCFKQDRRRSGRPLQPDESELVIDFSAEFPDECDRLDITARINSQPHHLVLEDSGNMHVAFRPPLANGPVSDLRAIQNGRQNHLYNVIATSHFPGNVRYERVFRVKLNIQQPAAQRPNSAELDYPHLRNPKASTVRSRKQLPVPSSNPLRSISHGDVRFQGRAVSEVITEAQEVHRAFYETYQDIGVHKPSILDKIYGQSLAPRQDFDVHAAVAPAAPRTADRERMFNRLGSDSENRRADHKSSPASSQYSSILKGWRKKRSEAGTPTSRSGTGRKTVANHWPLGAESILNPIEYTPVEPGKAFAKAIRAEQVRDNPFIGLNNKYCSQLLFWAEEARAKSGLSLKDQWSSSPIKSVVKSSPPAPPPSINVERSDDLFSPICNKDLDILSKSETNKCDLKRSRHRDSVDDESDQYNSTRGHTASKQPRRNPFADDSVSDSDSDSEGGDYDLSHTEDVTRLIAKGYASDRIILPQNDKLPSRRRQAQHSAKGGLDRAEAIFVDPSTRRDAVGSLSSPSKAETAPPFRSATTSTPRILPRAKRPLIYRKDPFGDFSDPQSRERAMISFLDNSNPPEELVEASRAPYDKNAKHDDRCKCRQCRCGKPKPEKPKPEKSAPNAGPPQNKGSKHDKRCDCHLCRHSMDKAEKPDVKAASFRFKTGPWDVTSGTKANKDDEFASKIHRSCMASPACMSLDNESECGDDSAYSFSKNNIPVPCDTHLSEQSADSMETVKPEKHPEIALPSQVEIQKNYAEAERALSRMSVGEDEVMGEDSDAVSLDRISFGAMSCSSPSTVEIPTPESEKD